MALRQIALKKVPLRVQSLTPIEHPRPITVALVDDEPLIRTALSRALAIHGLELVGEATTASAALKLAIDRRPDVVLIDIQLSDGLSAIEQIGLLARASRVLVLTRSEPNHVVEAIMAGASGYILKSVAADDVIDAIRATAAGEAVLSSKVARRLLQRIRDSDVVPVTATGDAAARAIRAVLTERELEIFSRLASGDSNQKIGRDLGLSTNTVSNHIASILGKLLLANRIQAAVQAVRAGIS